LALDKQKVARQFNRYVHTYDDVAVVQKRMAHRIMQTLKEKRVRPAEILEIGCGTGYLTMLLAEAFPLAKLTVVDLAVNMVDMTRERMGEKSVRYLVGDAEAITWDANRYDLIVSNATVQWFSDPKGTLRRMNEALSPGGWWVASTFGPDTFKELHEVFRKVETEYGYPAVQHGLPLRSPASWEQSLRDGGFSRVHTLTCWHRLSYPDCRSFLYAVRYMGASYSDSGHLSIGEQRRLLSEVIRLYDRSYREKKNVFATYQLVQMYGQKEM
jgi:malonyl-CoA O-methyltransferase